MYSLLDLLILLILHCGFCWLCVCLWFLVVVGCFFGGSFPLSLGQSGPHILFSLCMCGQVVLELVLLGVQGFAAFSPSCSVV